MRPQAFVTALTLFRSGTLTLPQAAVRAGCSESELASALRKRGIAVVEEVVDDGATRPVRAD